MHVQNPVDATSYLTFFCMEPGDLGGRLGLANHLIGSVSTLFVTTNQDSAITIRFVQT